MTLPEIFCLVDSNGRILPPATQATVLAKYSRSPLKAKEILADLTDGEADKFQDKWTIGYGHNSVAELASLPICMEGISIVASKFVESFPRGGYSEKSTRYQRFNKDSFVLPPSASPTMKEFASKFYETYDRLYDPCVRHIAEILGRDPKDETIFNDRVIKARVFDNLRYLLPAGTGTNVACVLDMRDVRSLISQARGHENSEIRMIGEKVHETVINYAPTLVKHAHPNTFEPKISSLGNLPSSFSLKNPNWYAEFNNKHLFPDPILTQKTFESIIAERHEMSWSTFCLYMKNRGEHQEVPKVFSTIKTSFDIMMDYGAYRDLQRHRRCEQYSELLTPNYGYIVPDDLIGTKMECEYRDVMDSIHDYDDDKVVGDVNLMQYVTPLGYLHRSVFEMDLKELYYIIELRSKIQGHISYRRIVNRLFELQNSIHPDIMQWCRCVDPMITGVHI